MAAAAMARVPVEDTKMHRELTTIVNSYATCGDDQIAILQIDFPDLVDSLRRYILCGYGLPGPAA